jgi:hypothetical protein
MELMQEKGTKAKNTTMAGKKSLETNKKLSRDYSGNNVV